MIRCPNCNNEISSWKVLLLTEFNNIHCNNCGRYLTLNKLRGRLIGGIGGGIGSLALSSAVHNFIYKKFGIINIILIVLWLSLLIIACLKFTKLEIDEEYEKYYK